jgi:hypothetical protein
VLLGLDVIDEGVLEAALELVLVDNTEADLDTDAEDNIEEDLDTDAEDNTEEDLDTGFEDNTEGDLPFKDEEDVNAVDDLLTGRFPSASSDFANVFDPGLLLGGSFDFSIQQ